MIDVRVIAPNGATVRAPAKLRLTKAQLGPRAHLVGKPDAKGVVALKDGAVMFKLGEEFSIDEFEGKLNNQLFEVIEKPGSKAAKKAEAEAAEKAKADAEAEAAAQAKADADAAAQAGGGA